MAIAKKDELQYFKDWAEVQEYAGKQYAEEVIEVLKNKGIADVTAKKIYNVMGGSVKDLDILAAIRQVLIKQPEPVKAPNLSKLKLEQV